MWMEVCERALTCVCASRRFEVSSVQLRLWHQMGVQQAPEEQAWPEVGGERRRPQVGGTFESLVLIVTFSREGRNLRLPLRFRLRPQGPCRVGTGESGIVLERTDETQT